MKYKHYEAVIKYDEDDNIFFGTVVGIREGITFHATNVRDLRKEFKISVDAYLDICTRRGEKPEKPHSGTCTLRLGPDLHAKAAIAAAKKGTSLNKLAATAIMEYLGK